MVSTALVQGVAQAISFSDEFSFQKFESVALPVQGGQFLDRLQARQRRHTEGQVHIKNGPTME